MIKLSPQEQCAMYRGMSIVLFCTAILPTLIGFFAHSIAVGAVAIALAIGSLVFLGLSYLVNWTRGCDNHFLSPKDNCAFCKLQKIYRE